MVPAVQVLDVELAQLSGTAVSRYAQTGGMGTLDIELPYRSILGTQGSSQR